MTLRLPVAAKGWSDEQVLARFTKGFFGGWVFRPERVALNIAGLQRKLVNFPLQGKCSSKDLTNMVRGADLKTRSSSGKSSVEKVRNLG